MLKFNRTSSLSFTGAPRDCVQCLDIGAGEVHQPAAAISAKSQPMAVLRAKKRNALPSGKFADPAERKYPIHDKAHADNAMARLRQQKGSMSPAKYKRVEARIRAAQKRFGETPPTANSVGRNRSIHIRMSSPDGTRTTIRHTLSASDGGVPAYYNEATDQFLTYVKIDKDAALGELDADNRVWVNVARIGAWAGHPQGAFQMTKGVFDALERNFHNSGVRRIQWDFNHCSAFPPSSGSIPAIGTPAQGWVYGLKNDGVNLYALTEWLPLAKQYIEGDQYDSASVVINWKTKDRVTGAEIGPTLRSIALTNEAFITGLQPLAADATGGTDGTIKGFMQLPEVDATKAQALDVYAYSDTGSLLRKLKQAFGLHELATAQHCSEALANLGAHLDAVDGDATATHEGIKLAGYVASLRDMVGGGEEVSSAELIQFIDALLDEYMAENGIEDDDSATQSVAPMAMPETDACMNSTAATAASVTGAAMENPVVPEAIAAPADPAVVTETAVATEVVAPAEVTAASATVATEVDPQVAVLALQNAALVAEKQHLETEIARLKAASGVATESALSAKVDAAYRTYKTVRGLSEELKPHLLSMLKSDPAGFDAMYPPVDVDKQHLLLDLTGGGASNPESPGARTEADAPLEIVDANAAPAATATTEAQSVALSLSGIMDALKIEKPHLTHDQRLSLADSLLHKARQA